MRAGISCEYVASRPGPANSESYCQLEQAGNKGRSDDCGSLRDNAISYIPRIASVPPLEPRTGKDKRGFHHPSTARLLCPQSLREEFDNDMGRFCHDVQNGNVVISHNDWPSFLYPEDGYNPNAIDENLLRGPFLLSVSQILPFEQLLTRCKVL